MEESGYTTTISTTINNSNNQSKGMWRSFNNEIGRGKKPTVINHLIQNGEKIQDPEKIGNMLCDFYASSPQSSDPDPVKLLQPHGPILDEIEISIANVADEIKRQKADKAEGADKIHIKFYKILVEPISIVLAYLFNLSIKHGIYPSCCKNGVVIPLYKNKGDLNSCRPITILP